MIHYSPRTAALFPKRLLAILLLAYMGTSDAVELNVEEPWIRVVPPVMKTTAAYMNLVNTTDIPIEVSRMESPQFGAVQYHQTIEEDGVMKMVHGGNLVVPANGHSALAPRGDHLMLMMSKVPLDGSMPVEIIIHFADGSYQKINPEFRDH